MPVTRARLKDAFLRGLQTDPVSEASKNKHLTAGCTFPEPASLRAKTFSVHIHGTKPSRQTEVEREKAGPREARTKS